MRNDMPSDWKGWVEENLLRGIPPQELIDILVKNNFSPAIASKTVTQQWPNKMKV